MECGTIWAEVARSAVVALAIVGIACAIAWSMRNDR